MQAGGWTRLSALRSRGGPTTLHLRRWELVKVRSDRCLSSTRPKGFESDLCNFPVLDIPAKGARNVTEARALRYAPFLSELHGSFEIREEDCWTYNRAYYLRFLGSLTQILFGKDFGKSRCGWRELRVGSLEPLFSILDESQLLIDRIQAGQMQTILAKHRILFIAKLQLGCFSESEEHTETYNSLLRLCEQVQQGVFAAEMAMYLAWGD